jgi:hypothetical protein
MILGTSRAVRVFAYPRPTDLRKGFDGLYGLVKSGLRVASGCIGVRISGRAMLGITSGNER